MVYGIEESFQEEILALQQLVELQQKQIATLSRPQIDPDESKYIEFRPDSPQSISKELLDELQNQKDRYAILEAKYTALVDRLQDLYREI